MMNNTQTEPQKVMNKTHKEVADGEHSRNTVPADQRKSWLSLSLVWAGIIFTVLSMTTGGGVISGLNFTDAMIAFLLGTVFLGIVAILLSIIACRTGLTFALMTRYVFGTKGSQIVTLLAPIANIGWFIIIAATFGHFIALVIGCGDTGEIICMVLSVIAMGIMAMFGFRALKVLSYITIPVIVVLCVYVSVHSVVQMGGIQAIRDYIPASQTTIPAALTAVIGTWISGCATGIPNFTRFSRNIKEAVLTCIVGMVIADMFMLVCGALTCMAYQSGDLPMVLVSMGLIVPGIILMAGNSFCSNVGSLYNISLSLTNSLPFKREHMLVVIIAVAAVCTAFKPYEMDFVFTVLNILGVVFTPLSGIIAADYFIINKLNYPVLENAQLQAWNIHAWIALILGVTGGFLIPWGSKALNALVISGIMYILLMKLFRTGLNSGEEEK